MVDKFVGPDAISWSFAHEHGEGEVRVSDGGVFLGWEGARWETRQCTLEKYMDQTAGPNHPTHRDVVRQMMPEAAAEIEEEVRRRLADPTRKVPAPVPLKAEKGWWEFWK
jgi:hypothetical protein